MGPNDYPKPYSDKATQSDGDKGDVVTKRDSNFQVSSSARGDYTTCVRERIYLMGEEPEFFDIRLFLANEDVRFS